MFLCLEEDKEEEEPPQRQEDTEQKKSKGIRTFKIHPPFKTW